MQPQCFQKIPGTNDKFNHKRKGLQTITEHCLTSLPGLTSRRAASEARWAAMTASAARPLILLSLELPMTTVCATTAMKPSMWAPRSNFTISPSCDRSEGACWNTYHVLAFEHDTGCFIYWDLGWLDLLKVFHYLAQSLPPNSHQPM